MNPEEVQKMIAGGLPDCEVKVTGDGSHFDATVIGEMFEGMSAVKKQQTVYKTLGDKITSGEVHALTIKAMTPAEYEQAMKLQVR